MNCTYIRSCSRMPHTTPPTKSKNGRGGRVWQLELGSYSSMPAIQVYLIMFHFAVRSMAKKTAIWLCLHVELEYGKSAVWLTRQSKNFHQISQNCLYIHVKPAQIGRSSLPFHFDWQSELIVKQFFGLEIATKNNSPSLCWYETWDLRTHVVSHYIFIDHVMSHH